MQINRILIVGLGSIGKRHLQLARALLPNADIRVLRHQVSTSKPEGADGCFSSIEEAISYAPQLAVISNPSTYHIHIAQPLADAGTHLLVEKPLSASLDGVEHLIETCREKGTVLMTAYNLRFFPSLQHFRKLLHNNTIGRVLSVRCEIGQFLPSWRPDTDYRQCVSACQILGGGVLLELSHELDYLRWIFGEIDWVKATLCKQSNMDIDVEDTAHLILGFDPAEDGRQLIGTVNLDFIRHDTIRKCIAIGENGTLRWNGLTEQVEQFEVGGKEWYEAFHNQHQRNDSYLAEWKHFLSCIIEQAIPITTGEDGLKVLEIIDAARQSSKLGNQIKIKKLEVKGKNSA